jgi:hypothetical protein
MDPKLIDRLAKVIGARPTRRTLLLGALLLSSALNTSDLEAKRRRKRHKAKKRQNGQDVCNEFSISCPVWRYRYYCLDWWPSVHPSDPYPCDSQDKYPTLGDAIRAEGCDEVHAERAAALANRAVNGCTEPSVEDICSASAEQLAALNVLRDCTIAYCHPDPFPEP